MIDTAVFLSLFVDYVVAIRETSMTLDNILTNGILALASAVGLCIAMNNLAKTTLQQFVSHIHIRHWTNYVL